MSSGNLWALFRGVTEQAGQQIATVLARNGVNYDVQSIGGSVSAATSSAAYEVGSKVFVRDGAIVGLAPDLPYVEIDV